MSEHNNIPENCELLARLWDGLKRDGDGKFYCPCSQCRGFKRRRINIAIAKRHCREYGHAEGGHEYRPFGKFFIIYVFILIIFVNVCIILIFLLLTNIS